MKVEVTDPDGVDKGVGDLVPKIWRSIAKTAISNPGRVPKRYDVVVVVVVVVNVGVVVTVFEKCLRLC